ncbi:MAG: PorT family protein [Fibrobacter sp.]|nr:PorT family protein [Fibrobacter sp.]
MKNVFIFTTLFLSFLLSYTWADDFESSEPESEVADIEDDNFENDALYADAFARYKQQKASTDFIETERLRNWTDAVSIGLKASIGSPTFLGENAESWAFGYSFNIGGLMRVRLSDLFSLSPEVTFGYRKLTSKLEESGFDVETDLTNITLDLPILFRFALDNHLGFFFYAGPQLNFIIKSYSTENKIFKTTPSQDNPNPEPIIAEDKNPIHKEPIEIGGALGFGYQFNRWVGIDFRCFYALTSFVNSTFTEAEYYHNLKTLHLQISGSYLF